MASYPFIHLVYECRRIKGDTILMQYVYMYSTDISANPNVNISVDICAQQYLICKESKVFL